MKKILAVFTCVLALLLTACSSSASAAPPTTVPFSEPAALQQEIPSVSLGGVLRLSVNPEIAVFYDENGTVTKVEGRNEDGSRILADYSGFLGKDCKTVVAELVTAIGEAGYFVDDIDGSRRNITLEIEPGSYLPSDAFLTEVAGEVRLTVDSNSWAAPLTHSDAPVMGICTNPDCKDNDCDDLYCDAGVCTNPYCDDWDCDDADCDDNVPGPDRDVRTCTNPNCKDNDCDDLYCDAGICTNPYCDDWDCDDADCDDNVPGPDRDVRTCTNPNCKDNDCDDRYCDAGVCTNPYCDDWDCDDADCDEGHDDDHDDHDDHHGHHDD